jgi:hypothetical protein
MYTTFLKVMNAYLKMKLRAKQNISMSAYGGPSIIFFCLGNSHQSQNISRIFGATSPLLYIN